jgi:hypothetical protein
MNASTTMGTLHLAQVSPSTSNTRLRRLAQAMRRGRRRPEPVAGAFPGHASRGTGCSARAGSLDAGPIATGGEGSSGRKRDRFANTPWYLTRFA